jgi:diamine N-acetyltransferase
MTPVYIRKLQHGDHLISYHWRNDPLVWEYTGSRPDREITADIEEQWILRVTNDPTSMRYAICVQSDDRYIGNVQLTGIENDTAEFHIFIGDTSYWGKGAGVQATRQMVAEGFARGLKLIFLYVNSNNAAAIRVYEKCGFRKTGIKDNDIRMEITPADMDS